MREPQFESPTPALDSQQACTRQDTRPAYPAIQVDRDANQRLHELAGPNLIHVYIHGSAGLVGRHAHILEDTTDRG